MLKNLEFKTWIDDTKYPCPAQCYYYFENNGDYYCIYLRWRYEDPWWAWLIKFKDKTLDWDECLWFDLELEKKYKLEELEELKIQSRKKVIKILKL